MLADSAAKMRIIIKSRMEEKKYSACGIFLNKSPIHSAADVAPRADASTPGTSFASAHGPNLDVISS